MNKIFLISVIFVIIIAGLSNATSIENKTYNKNIITVDNEAGDGDYTSIQEAIDNANSGDIIEVYSGTYYELITIDKQLILRGIDSELGIGSNIGNPIIDNDYTSTGPIVKIKADNVEITGFIIEDFHKWRDSSGIKIISNNNKIMHNVIRKTMGSHGGSAIWIEGKNNNEISYNEIYTMKDGWTSIFKGVEIEGGTNNKVHHNVFRYVNWGVHLNTLVSHVSIIYPKNNKIYRNRFFNMSDVRLIGNNNLISENYFELSNIVMGFEDCHQNLIYRNNFLNVDNGVWIWNAVKNDIIENNFVSSDAYFLLGMDLYFDEDMENFWDGNFWNKPRTLPYKIEGEWYRSQGGPTFPGYRFDNNPAKETYIIPTGVNQKPAKPSTPEGTNSAKKGNSYIYTSTGDDPDGHYIYYLFDWGDGSNSGWIGPYDSREECEASHIWTEKGNYNIKVKTKDIYGYESEFSDSTTVHISKAICKNSMVLEFLKNYPILYQLFERFFQDLKL